MQSLSIVVRLYIHHWPIQELMSISRHVAFGVSLFVPDESLVNALLIDRAVASHLIIIGTWGCTLLSSHDLCSLCLRQASCALIRIT